MTRRTLVKAVAAVLFVAAVFAVLATGLLPYRLYVVHTGSMSPTFQSTSAVLVHTGDYRVGEPVSFLANGEVVTHRLISVDSDGEIVTRGDANATPDPWHLTTRSIIGGVVSYLPHLGYWLQFLKNPFGLLAILCAVAVCWQLWTFADPAPVAAALRSKHRIGAPRHGRTSRAEPRRNRGGMSPAVTAPRAKIPSTS
jgi:signal peptidase